MFKQSKQFMIAAVFGTGILLMPLSVSAFDFMKQAQDAMGVMGNTKMPALNKSGVSANALSNSDMVAGLKDALRVGSERVVGQLGQADGFNADKNIHIPLPDSMKKVKSALAAVGMGSYMDDLELKLNRAAETATPKAKKLFGNAIKDMNVDDAKRILNGPNDAATQYFKGKMSKPLRAEMKPIVEQSLAKVGAVQSYEQVMGKYKSLPFVPDAKADLTSHVLDKGLDGIFLYLAKEEAAIRKDPVKRTTSILKKVFAK